MPPRVVCHGRSTEGDVAMGLENLCPSGGSTAPLRLLLFSVLCICRRKKNKNKNKNKKKKKKKNNNKSKNKNKNKKMKKKKDGKVGRRGGDRKKFC